MREWRKAYGGVAEPCGRALAARPPTQDGRHHRPTTNARAHPSWPGLLTNSGYSLGRELFTKLIEALKLRNSHLGMTR